MSGVLYFCMKLEVHILDEMGKAWTDCEEIEATRKYVYNKLGVPEASPEE